MPSRFLVYGSTGFVGNVIVRLALQQGLHPIVAGRNAALVQAQANELGVPHRTFSLDDSAALDAALADVPVVLHCAGPYIYTFQPMAEACLRTGTHYLDLTGEIPVYQALAARDADAQTKHVMLLPGVGFDVVPTDCLALHLKQRLPSATHLALAWCSRGPTKLPPGTIKTMLDGVARKTGILARHSGQIEPIPIAQSRTVDFGDGPVKAYPLTWGDIFTAYFSTGIPNIETYSVLPESALKAMKALAGLSPLLQWPAMRDWVGSKIPAGPTPEERAQTQTYVWGEVEDDQGRKAAARLEGPEAGVTWTAQLALNVVQEVLAGHAPSGFQTPARAYGSDFVLASAGVARQDLS